MDAPPYPVPAELQGSIDALEKLSYFQRRIIVKRRMPGQYPRFFYKFRAANTGDSQLMARLRGFLIDSRLWLSDHASFNDPFDMKADVVIEGTPEEIEARFRSLLEFHGEGEAPEIQAESLKRIMALPPTEKDAIIQNVFRASAGQVGICSFGGDPRSILMWAHYAQNHEGICFQFSFAGDPRTFAWAQEVEYKDEYPRINWRDRSSVPDALYAVLTRKHPGWRYENEWRLVHLAGAKSLLPFRPESLVGVILGSRANEHLKDAVIAVLDERKAAGLPSVRLFKAEEHWREYRLVIRRIGRRGATPKEE